MAIATPDAPVVQPAVAPDNPQTDSPLQQAIRLLNTPDAFARWLLDQGADTRVGYAQKFTSCPLATWLSSATRTNAKVGSCIFKVSDENSADLPKWATSFVRNVDLSHGHSEPISASEAIASLDNAIQGYRP